MQAGNFDRNLAILGFAASIAITVFLWQTFKSLPYVLTGALTAAACLTWLYLQNKKSIGESTIGVSKQGYSLMMIVFLAFFALSIVIFNTRPDIYVRPLEYFFLVSAMAGVVSLEVLLAPSETRYTILTLAQIIVIGFSLGFSETLLFPSVVGGDPFWHQAFTNRILSLGHIPEGYSYSRLPMFHLGIAATSSIVALDYKISAMLFVQSIQIISSACFVFLLGRALIGQRIGMLAGLLVTIANVEIHAGFWTIPTTLGFILVPMATYSLLMSKGSKRHQFTFVAIVLMTALILTHPIAALSMAIVLLVGTTISAMSKSASKVNALRAFSPGTTLLFAAAMISWWTFATESLAQFLDLMAGGFSINLFTKAPSGVIEYSSNVPLGEQLLDNLGIFIFFASSFLGCFYMTSKKFGKPTTSMLAVAGLIMLALPYGSLVSRIHIVNDRWWQIAEIMLSLPLACSFLMVFSNLKRRRTRVLLCSAILMLSILMSMSTTANIDNSVLSPDTNVRAALTESELRGGAESMNLFKVPIGSDLFYASALIETESTVVSIDSQLLAGTFLDSGHNLVLIREEIIQAPFYMYQSLPWTLNYDPRVVLDSEGFSQVFDCGSVTGYLMTE